MKRREFLKYSGASVATVSANMQQCIIKSEPGRARAAGFPRLVAANGTVANLKGKHPNFLYQSARES